MKNEHKYIGRLYKATIDCQFSTTPESSEVIGLAKFFENIKIYKAGAVFLLVEILPPQPEDPTKYCYGFLDKDGKKVYRFLSNLDTIEWLEKHEADSR